MTRRIVSSLVLWAVVIAVLWIFKAGGAAAMIAMICALTLREFYRLQEAAGFAPFTGLGMCFGALVAAAPWLEARFGWPAHPLLALAIVTFSIRVLGEREPESRAGSLASTLFGLMYVAVLMQYLTRIATPLPGDTISADGRLLLCIWVVAVAKFCDTGAMLAGLAFGRHLMAPRISPKKTWEGVAGGLAMAALVGACFAHFARREFPSGLTPVRAAMISVPIAALAIVSDLVESLIKRQAAIKDSGASIPGIGGLFDVVDSVLLAAPAAWFLLGLR